MLQRHDYLNIDHKSVLVILCILCLTSINLAQGNAWVYKTPMPTGRGFTSGTVEDGKIYMIGGFPTHNSVTNANEMYDPATDTWTSMMGMPEGRCAHATCTYDGKIYVFGGVSPDPYASAKNNVYVYDPQTDTWTQKANMPYANAFCGIAVVNDTIYLVGGMLNYAATPVSTVMAYYPLTDTWAEKAHMPTARGMLSACAVEGKIYAIGGTINFISSSFNIVEVYDPATNTWATKTGMPTARVSLAICVMDEKIYAIGGYTYPVMYTINEMYDPALVTWVERSPMQEKRQTFFLGSVDNQIYAIGGSYPNPQNPAMPVILNSVEAYTTSNIGPGNVSGTWSLDGSPYYINGEITIPNDSTLTIEPGVKVVFTGHYKFYVKGRLLAIGTETDTILFTINDTTGFHYLTLPDGGWHGIKILDIASSNDSTIFEYCTFEYGKSNTGSGIVNRSGGAINTNLDKLRISHCLFRNNKSYSTDTWEGTSGAILISGNGIIENCEFSWNKSSWGSAMCVGGNTTGAIIRNNHFHHNTGHGTINVCVDAYPTIINNIIEYNHSYGEPSTPHGHGILHFSNNNNAGYAKIINNTIVNNTNVGEGGGIFVRDGNPTFINNIVYGNEPSQVNFLWASSVGFYNCLIEGGQEGFTGAAFTGTYENCIDDDPQFVNSNDYHLQNTSPCIGEGIDSILIGSHWYYCPRTDFDGNPRPNPSGSMPDIGACENELGDPLTAVDGETNQLPTKFALAQNYPNPFNPVTKIRYRIPLSPPLLKGESEAGGFVTLKVYDILGNEIATLINKEQLPGEYEVEFNASSLPSGVYFYQLKAGEFLKTRKMILLK